MPQHQGLAVPRRTALRAVPKKDPYKGLRASKLRKVRDRLAREGNLNQAIEVAMRLTRVDPGRESYFTAGLLLNNFGEYRKALKQFRDALRFQDGPKYLVSEIQIHAAYSWYRLKDSKRLGEALRRAHASGLRPRSIPKYHHMLGVYYYGREKAKRAAEEFDKARRLATSRAQRGRAAADMARSLIDLGRLDEAAHALDDAIKDFRATGERPFLANAQAVRAQIHFDLGEKRKALHVLMRVVKGMERIGFKPRLVEALQNAGYVASDTRELGLARSTLNRAIALGSEHAEWQILGKAFCSRAWVNFREDRFGEGNRDLENARRLFRGRNFPVGKMFLSRTEARVAGLFADWATMRKAALQGERVAKRIGDRVRVVEFRKLRAEAESALGRHRAACDVRKKAARLEKALPGLGTSMSKVLGRVDRLGRASMHVLIVGEDGTEKRELAWAIQTAGRRTRRPALLVPCEQVSMAAVEFGGAEAGAWSGATRRMVGAFEKADGGTLILDRVDDLARADQRVLLRMVDGHVRPVGGGDEKPCDVRVLATCTNEDLILPELRTRLSGARLEIPPLRERHEEFPGLVEYLLAGRRSITCDAVAKLAEWPWRGNLVELRAVIERMEANTEGPIGIKAVHQALKTAKTGRLERRVNKLRKLHKLAAMAL